MPSELQELKLLVGKRCKNKLDNLQKVVEARHQDAERIAVTTPHNSKTIYFHLSLIAVLHDLVF